MTRRRYGKIIKKSEAEETIADTDQAQEEPECENMEGEAPMKPDVPEDSVKPEVPDKAVESEVLDESVGAEVPDEAAEGGDAKDTSPQNEQNGGETEIATTVEKEVALEDSTASESQPANEKKTADAPSKTEQAKNGGTEKKLKPTNKIKHPSFLKSCELEDKFSVDDKKKQIKFKFNSQGKIEEDLGPKVAYYPDFNDFAKARVLHGYLKLVGPGSMQNNEIIKEGITDGSHFTMSYDPKIDEMVMIIRFYGLAKSRKFEKKVACLKDVVLTRHYKSAYPTTFASDDRLSRILVAYRIPLDKFKSKESYKKIEEAFPDAKLLAVRSKKNTVYAYLLYRSVLAMRKALAKNLNTLKLGGWRTCFSVLTEQSGETQIPNHHYFVPREEGNSISSALYTTNAYVMEHALERDEYEPLKMKLELASADVEINAKYTALLRHLHKTNVVSYSVADVIERQISEGTTMATRRDGKPGAGGGPPLSRVIKTVPNVQATPYDNSSPFVKPFDKPALKSGQKKQLLGNTKPFVGGNKPLNSGSRSSSSSSSNSGKPAFGGNRSSFGGNNSSSGANRSLSGANRASSGANRSLYGANRASSGANRAASGSRSRSSSNTSRKSTFGRSFEQKSRDNRRSGGSQFGGSHAMAQPREMPYKPGESRFNASARITPGIASTNAMNLLVNLSQALTGGLQKPSGSEFPNQSSQKRAYPTEQQPPEYNSSYFNSATDGQSSTSYDSTQYNSAQYDSTQYDSQSTKRGRYDSQDDTPTKHGQPLSLLASYQSQQQSYQQQPLSYQQQSSSYKPETGSSYKEEPSASYHQQPSASYEQQASSYDQSQVAYDQSAYQSGTQSGAQSYNSGYYGSN